LLALLFSVNFHIMMFYNIQRGNKGRSSDLLHLAIKLLNLLLSVPVVLIQFSYFHLCPNTAGNIHYVICHLTSIIWL
uniref:Uncharacterized protein n=1 Tax=Aegilops tauschii subsp. strangulata TaxID=200361 RepID=A0A453RBC0_AEGTS